MRQRWLLILWILVNWIAITLSLLTFFFSYVSFQISTLVIAAEHAQLVGRLSVCLFFQSCCLAGPQTLLIGLGINAYKKGYKWFVGVVGGTLLGGLLPLIPVLFSIESNHSLFPYFGASLFSAWLVGGFLGGQAVATGRAQKRQWGLINAGAFFMYLLAISAIPVFLGAALDGVAQASSGLLLVVVCIYLPITAIGSLLNGIIIRALASQNND